MSVNPIPDGYHTVTPYLILDGAGKAIEFYKKAFGATEVMRLPGPGDKVAHAEIEIGDSRIMMADEQPDMGFQGPRAHGGTSVSICLYVEEVDTVFQQALDAGAKQLRPLQDQFYGDRSGTLEDPFGHVWTIATHTEDLSPEEVQERMQGMYE